MTDELRIVKKGTAPRMRTLETEMSIYTDMCIELKDTLSIPKDWKADNPYPKMRSCKMTCEIPKGGNLFCKYVFKCPYRIYSEGQQSMLEALLKASEEK